MRFLTVISIILFCFLGCDNKSNSSGSDSPVSNDNTAKTTNGVSCVVDGETYNAGSIIPSEDAFTSCRCKEDGTSVCDISSPVGEEGGFTGSGSE